MSAHEVDFVVRHITLCAIMHVTRAMLFSFQQINHCNIRDIDADNKQDKRVHNIHIK